MKRKFGDDYAFCPPTYILSEDFSLFKTEKEADPKAVWILKPVASSCGKGIRIIPKGTKVHKREYYLLYQ